MARSFNGTSDYLTIASAPTPGPSTSAVTMACWAYGDSDPADRRVLMALDTAAGTDLYAMLVDWATVGNPIELLAQTAVGTFHQIYTTSGVSTGSWFHACGVFASETSRTVYLNGANSATTSVSITSVAPDNFSIGSRIFSGARGRYHPGKIAEAALWNVALTATEIASLADGVAPIMVRPDALVTYWPLMGRTSPEIDVMGGSHLTVSGAAQSAHPPMRYRSRVQAWKYGAAAPASIVGPLVHSRLVGRSPLIGGRLAA